MKSFSKRAVFTADFTVLTANDEIKGDSYEIYIMERKRTQSGYD